MTSASATSRITVVDASDSEEEYASTVEELTTAPRPISSFTTVTRKSYVISQEDVSRRETTTTDQLSMREMHVAAARRAVHQKLNMVSNTPEMHPLLLRINPIHKAMPVVITGTRSSTPVQVVHLVKAKKHIVRQRMVSSLEIPLHCYEVVPSFGVRMAEQIFILTPKVQNVKARVLPSTQKIKTGTLPRKTSVPQLLLPPEGPRAAQVLQPLWDTVTLTIALGKHVAVEYSIPQVPLRKVKQYKAEKHVIKYVDSAILYRHTPEERVVVLRADQPHQLRLSTVERQDPQLVQLVRVEQNRWETRQPQLQKTRREEVRVRTASSVSIETTRRPARGK